MSNVLNRDLGKSDTQRSGVMTPDSGRVPTITGAGRGLGRAMTLGLARAGIRVVATAARERAEIEAIMAEVDEGMILPVLADVTHEVDAERVVAAALERFGRLDILVNSACRGMRHVRETSMTEPKRFWEVEPNTWRILFDTNVNGPFLMARAATPHMARAGWGRIVNISMNRSTMRRAGFYPYAPSKAALESETPVWAQDLAGTGVTVNTPLSGGATLTGMIPDTFPANARGTLLDPGIMAPPLLWLVSEETNAITGCRVTANRWENGNPLTATESAGWGSDPMAPPAT